MHLLRALLYLRFQSIRNVLAVRMRRLKQPKYLFGLLAGLAYFWFFFLRHAMRTGPGGAAPSLGTVFGGHIELIAAAVLSIFVILIWVLPGSHPGLAFTEAEVAFLFPAPLTRRQLIQYKLLDGLAMSLFGAMFFTLLSSGLRHGWLGALLQLGAWWSLNANLSLHQTAAALTISRLTRAGFSTIVRRVVFITAAVLVLIAMIVISVNSGLDGLKWLLLPARLAVAPFLATTPAGYLLALLPAFGLVAVHYFWVLQMESPFEDATLVRAQKRSETVARLREGRGLRLGSGPTKARREPFRLGDRLPPEFALLWKNLMAAPSYLNRRMFAGTALVLTFGVLWLKGHMPPVANAVGFVALAFLAYVLAFGPQLARNDLRGDLLNVDLLKTYPLPGWRIMLGSLLAPAVILTGIGWLLLLVAALGLAPSPRAAQWLTPQFRITAALAIAAVLPVLSAVQLLVPNAATLIFPAWAQTSRHAAGGGVDVLGQRLIFFAGQMLCLLAAVLPALVAGGGTIFITQWLIGLPAATALAVVPVLGIFLLEVWLGAWWLGPKFERLDISSELRP